MDSNDENQTSNDVEERNGEAPKTEDQDMISKLRRSNSVSMKASLFSQLEKDNKKAAEEQKGKKKNGKEIIRVPTFMKFRGRIKAFFPQSDIPKVILYFGITSQSKKFFSLVYPFF